MSSPAIRPARPKFPGECEAIGLAADDFWGQQDPSWCIRFGKWFNDPNTLQESREAWGKHFRLGVLPKIYGDPKRETRTKKHRQAMNRQLPKRPNTATPTSPFDLVTATPHCPSGQFFGANIPVDRLEALFKIGRGHTSVQLDFALEHVAKLTGCPVGIELNNRKGDDNPNIRKQFGISGEGYRNAAHVLRSAGLVFFPDTPPGKRYKFTILGPYIGFDDKGWVHYLDGLPVRKVYETEVEAGSAESPPTGDGADDKDILVAGLRLVHRVGDQELTTYPLENTRAKQILLDGEPYYPPYHKFLTTGEYLTQNEINAIGRRLNP